MNSTSKNAGSYFGKRTLKSFEKCDILLTPTTPSMPFKFGEKSHDPYQMYLTDVLPFLQLWRAFRSLLNCGYHQHLPIGLQILEHLFRKEKYLVLLPF